METEGGGWTIIQRRLDGSVNFYRSWNEYENGFGNVTREFWLGLKYISKLSSNCRSTLRVELQDFEEDRRHAEYSYFYVSSYRYQLYVSGYSGTAGDSLYSSGPSVTRHNRMYFSTRDRDYDNYPLSCAQIHRSGWWFNRCMQSNLNAPYSENPRVSYIRGITWITWRGSYYSYKGTEMKVRCQ